jgi:predicted small secreted protein
MDLDSSVESVSSPRFDAFLAGVARSVTVIAYGGNKNYYVHLDPETGEVTDIVEE